jgi:hypothetical protein
MESYQLGATGAPTEQFRDFSQNYWTTQERDTAPIEMISTKIEKITPDMAVNYLKNNYINRNLSRLVVNQYATDMKNGKWALSHQGIAFYETGNLADGQHRLYAVIKSGCTIEMQVTRGLPVESGTVIDQGNKRSFKDALIIGDDKCNKWLTNNNNAAAVKAVISIYKTSKSTASIESTIKVGNAIKEHVEFIVHNQKTHERGLTTAPFIAALILARININTGKATDAAFVRFQEICGGGATLSENELAAHTLRNFARNHIRGTGSSDRMVLAKATQYAFSKFVNGHKLTTLRFNAIEELLYPIPPDLGELIANQLG